MTATRARAMRAWQETRCERRLASQALADRTAAAQGPQDADRSPSTTARRFDLAAEYLRVRSPSAEVQGHSPDERKTVAGKKNVAILEVNPIGNYAVRLVFDDMHSTGIYQLGLSARARPQSRRQLAGLSRRARGQGIEQVAMDRSQRSWPSGLLST